MEQIQVKGIVLRQTEVKDNDRLITVLTDQRGKISMSAKAAKSYKRSLLEASRVFCYAEYILIPHTSGIYSVSSCTPLENFMGLAQDLDRLKTATALVKFAEFIAQENEDCSSLLRLLLNSLYVLSKGTKPIRQVVSVFFLKCISLLGYEPDLTYCSACGQEEDLPFFSVEYGGCLCTSCAPNVEDADPLSPQAKEVMRYIFSSADSRIFSFSASDEILRKLISIIRKFLSYHLDYKL